MGLLERYMIPQLLRAAGRGASAVQESDDYQRASAEAAAAASRSKLQLRATHVRAQLKEQFEAGAIERDEYEMKIARVAYKLSADLAAIDDALPPRPPRVDREAAESAARFRRAGRRIESWGGWVIVLTVLLVLEEAYPGIVRGLAQYLGDAIALGAALGLVALVALGLSSLNHR